MNSKLPVIWRFRVTMDTIYLLSALILILLPHANSRECYVPVCDTGLHTLFELFISLDLSSGNWTTSWDFNHVKRPKHACSGDQVATVLQGSSDSPYRMRAENEWTGGDPTCVPSIQFLQMYLNAIMTWVVDLMPEDWQLLSILSFWLKLIRIMARTLLQILYFLASNWQMISSLAFLVKSTVKMAIYIAWILYRSGLRVIARYCWIWGCLRQRGTRAVVTQAQLEEEVRRAGRSPTDAVACERRVNFLGCNVEEDGQSPQASRSKDDDMQPNTDLEMNCNDNLSLILKGLQELRKEASQQLKGIREDLNKVCKRMEEAEERI